MQYLSKEDTARITDNAEKRKDTRTPEHIKKMKELGEKVKKLSPEERWEIRRKLDEEDRYY